MFFENTSSENKPISCQSVRRLLSPAKLNLGLSIIGRDSSGYHLLESLFWPISLCDDISIAPSEFPSVRCTWDDSAPILNRKLPAERDNLGYQALSNAPYKVTIRKRIPTGSGLGGGSSNAGTILKFLSTDSKINPSSLGADVPYFLSSQPAWVTGRGQHVRVLSVERELLEGLQFLLVFPPFENSTKAIFDRYRGKNPPFSPPIDPFPDGHISVKNLTAYLKSARNSLEPAILSESPSLGEILSQLRASSALYSGVSGTGSTCFSVYFQPDEKALKDLLQLFRSHDCRAVIVRTFIAE